MLALFASIDDSLNFYETYSLQKLKYSRKTGRMVFSSSTTKISVRVGPSRGLVATPSVCL